MIGIKPFISAAVLLLGLASANSDYQPGHGSDCHDAHVLFYAAVTPTNSSTAGRLLRITQEIQKFALSPEGKALTYVISKENAPDASPDVQATLNAFALFKTDADVASFLAAKRTVDLVNEATPDFKSNILRTFDFP